MSRANQVRGEVEVEVAEKRFVLEPSFERISQLETALGRSLVQFATELGQGRGMTYAEAASFLSLTSKEPRVSYLAAGKLIAEAGIMSVVEPLNLYLRQVLLQEDRGDEPENPPSGVQ